VVKKVKSARAEPDFPKKFVTSNLRVITLPRNIFMIEESRITSALFGERFRAYNRAIFLTSFGSEGLIYESDH
jgi:hypothetical protein